MKRPRRRHQPKINLERAVHVFGAIGPELMAAIGPDILRLRDVSDEPITLMVDSPGGEVYYAEVIFNLASAATDPDSSQAVIGVCVAQAASAAADLLCRCHYAVAYPHSRFLVHGVARTAEYVTQGDAVRLSSELRQANERWVRSIAPHVFGRILDNYGRKAGDFARIRQENPEVFAAEPPKADPAGLDIVAFAASLCETLESGPAQVVAKTLAKLDYWQKLADEARNPAGQGLPQALLALLEKRPEDARAPLTRQLTALQALILERLTSDEDWTLNSDALEDLGDDIGPLLEILDPTFEDELLVVLVQHADVFFSAEDLEFVAAVSEKQADLDDPPTARKFDEAVERAYERIKPLWTFVIALCRELQLADNRFTPEDAFWLGWIDEIHGAALSRRR